MASADPLDGHRFGSSRAFRVGAEEELFLVEPERRSVVARTDAVLARCGGDGVAGEMEDGVVELITPICEDADEAVAALAERRERIRAAVDDVELLGTGIHPAAGFGDVRFRRSEHYDQVEDETRGVLRQSVFCGLHVHVGLPDRETAVAACNGMRRWMPLLQALAANSPIWHGRDSGLASTRCVRQRSLPRSGIPRAFADWDDCAATMRELIRVSETDGIGSLWWDVRPQPVLGTLEVRVLDAQSGLADVRGLVALVHGLVRHEAAGRTRSHPSPDVLDEASFRAMRDGLDARVSLGGRITPLREHAQRALELAAGALERPEALREVERLLEDGTGAERQRRAFAAGGVDAVLEHLADATVAPAFATS